MHKTHGKNESHHQEEKKFTAGSDLPYKRGSNQLCQGAEELMEILLCVSCLIVLNGTLQDVNTIFVKGGSK